MRPAPAVTASVRTASSATASARVKGQVVTFLEEGRGVSRTIGTARGARGTLKFAPADGPGGRRTVVALVEQDGLPRKRLTVATFKAPPRSKPGKPRGVKVAGGTARAASRRRPWRRGRGDAGGRPRPAPCAASRPLTITWRPAARAARYGVTVELTDGRRLFFLRDADDRVVRIPDAKGLVSVRVVGLRADNGAGPAATANDNERDR